jgi:hypothetical protein
LEVLSKLNKTLPNFGQKKKSFVAFNQLQQTVARWRNIEHSREFGVNYDFNYKRAVVWDNKFILAYGLSKIKGDNKTAKTDDRLELNSIWGKAKGDWYYWYF